MKLDILFLLSIGLAACAAAAPPPQALTVAVYGFTDVNGKREAYAGKVSTLVTADLTAETNLVMVERSQLKKALNEQALGDSGMVNSDTAAKIGQITGVKVLISGQVIQMGPDHLILIADIIGTETGRLFAAKVEGGKGNFMALTSELSRKIAREIRDEAVNLVAESHSHEETLDRIVKSVTGTNRPTVSVVINWPQGPSRPCATANTEMGVLLLKAGFTVVDNHSERKPDMEIRGIIDVGQGPRRGDLFSSRSHVDLKIRERRTGRIIAFDHQTADAVDDSKIASDKSAEANVIDSVADRILPLLAQQIP